MCAWRILPFVDKMAIDWFNNCGIGNMGHPRLGYYFLDIGLKDFVFAIFQIQNLYGINLKEKYWIIQIISIFMVVVIFCMHM
jgi:hypothetical protein